MSQSAVSFNQLQHSICNKVEKPAVPRQSMPVMPEPQPVAPKIDSQVLVEKSKAADFEEAGSTVDDKRSRLTMAQSCQDSFTDQMSFGASNSSANLMPAEMPDISQLLHKSYKHLIHTAYLYPENEQ